MSSKSLYSCHFAKKQLHLKALTHQADVKEVTSDGFNAVHLLMLSHCTSFFSFSKKVVNTTADSQLVNGTAVHSVPV